jgi:hypothetical protein
LEIKRLWSLLEVQCFPEFRRDSSAAISKVIILAGIIMAGDLATLTKAVYMVSSSSP